MLPAMDLVNRRWLHLRVEGLEHLRAEPVLYVGNHNGGVMGPDLSCTLATLWRALGPYTPLYAMAHDFAMRHVTPLGRFLQSVGAMRADPANAERVLTSGHPVLAYPGGDLDAFRHFRDRNRIVFGPRTGFVRLAQRARVPIVPVVAQGAHQSAIILHEGEWLARTLGLTRWSRLQRFPVALALPWGLAPGPWMPYLPLPFPVRLRILPPIEVPPEVEPIEMRDEVVRRMQAAMDDLAGGDSAAPPADASAS
jgi:1-acyl-sn-glycerol-3-phosphate acyltransferase